MNNSFGIYSENLEQDMTLIHQLGEQCKKLGDTVIFTDAMNSGHFTDYAVFPSFYVRFFQGVVIFFNMEDYTQYKDIVVGKPMLYLTEDMLQTMDVDRSMVTPSAIFSVSGGYA